MQHEGRTRSTSSPRWRGDEARRDGRREWIRKQMPGPRDGFVAEDLDLVIRWFGKQAGHIDDRGRFMLCELKLGNSPASIGTSKEFTFGYLHECIEYADPVLSEEPRYRGFFTITTATEDWEKTEEFHVNSTTIGKSAFISWLRCDPGTWGLIEGRTFTKPRNFK